MSTHNNSIIKTYEEIQNMKAAGKILAEILGELKSRIKPNVNTWDLEKTFIKLCEKNKVIPACKGYDPYGMHPFPTGLCLSINNESVHCYPKKNKILKEGDIVTIDTVIKMGDVFADSAFCSAVGKVSENKRHLLETTEKAFYEAVSKVRAGARVGEISNALYTATRKEGFNVLRDYAGHGIGKSMHEYPEIPCYGNITDGPTLLEGMTICIESLVCEGSPKMTHLNVWETRMSDGKNWAQYEHTVLVKKDGYELITV